MKVKKRKFEAEKTKYTCKCGHRVYIPTCRGKALCDWCGKYVFIDEKKEFEYRFLEKQRKILI